MRFLKEALLIILLMTTTNGRVFQGFQPEFKPVTCDNFFIHKLKNLEKWRDVFLETSVAPKDTEPMCKSVWAGNNGSCCNVDKMKEIAETNMLYSASSTKRFIDKLAKLKSFFSDNKSKLVGEISSLERKIRGRRTRRERKRVRGRSGRRILQHIKFNKIKIDSWMEEQKKKRVEFNRREETRYKKKEKIDVEWETTDDSNLERFKKNVEILTNLLNGKFEDLEKKYRESIKTCTDFSQNFKAGTLCYLCSGNTNNFLLNAPGELLVKITKDSCSKLASSCSWVWNFNFKVNLGLRSYYYLKHALKNKSPVEWYPNDKYSKFDDSAYSLSGDMDRIIELLTKKDDASMIELTTTESKVCRGLFKAFGTNTIIEGEIEDVERAEQIIEDSIEEDDLEDILVLAKAESSRLLQNTPLFEGTITIVDSAAPGIKPEASNEGLMLDEGFIIAQENTGSFKSLSEVVIGALVFGVVILLC